MNNMMSHRNLFYFYAFLSAAIFLLLVRNVSAQPGCYEVTTYLIRDEAGKIMSLQEMGKITVIINGVPLKLRYDIVNREPAYYEYEYVNYFGNKIIRDTGKIPFANPLSVSIQPNNACGKAGDLELSYGGKQMRLFFDIDRARYSTIDSLPFQSGTFHLNRAMKPAECKSDSPCIVSSANWENAGKNAVRHPVLNSDWISDVKVPPERCNQPIAAINNQKDWTTAWEVFQRDLKASTDNGNNMETQRLPAIDFRAETVLIIYVRNLLQRPSENSFVVNLNGDLTFQPPPVAKAWHRNFCHMLVVVIYRSGVKSIEGNPLSSPALQ